VLFDDIAGRFPLVLAGHTHAGRSDSGLPPLYMPKGCRPYVSGLVHARGLAHVREPRDRLAGTAGRIGCRPELAVFELEPAVVAGATAPTDKAAEVGSLRPTGPR
jgi:predicted MPP superfamily phosphohydrolase